ncbi:hypothetical protein D9M69_658970 [compost metagenome]
MGHLARVAAKERQRHGKHRGDLAIVGLVFDVIRHQPDIGRDLNPMTRHQRTQRPDNLDQPRRQADFLFGLTQRGANQIEVFRIATTARKSHFAAVGGQPAGAQGQHHFRLVAAGDRDQNRRLGEAAVGLQKARTVAANALE